MPFIGFVLAWLITGALGAQAHAACLGKLEAVHSSTTIVYNPFDNQDLKATLVIRVQNSGSETCSYRVHLAPRSFPLQFSQLLNFSLASPSAPAGASLSSSGLDLSTNKIAPGQRSDIPLTLVIPRGQSVGSGHLESSALLSLWAANAPPAGGVLDQAELPLACDVPALFQINIAGGGLVTTVNFGELRQNDQRTVVLQTRCTQNYKVQLTSQNSGSLMLEDGGEATTSHIGYYAFFDGQNINFADHRSIQYSAANFYENHKLMIQVGDISNKRAGLYKDVIVIRIMSAI